MSAQFKSSVMDLQYRSMKSLCSISNERSFYSVNCLVPCPYLYRPSFNLLVTLLLFCGITDHLYAHDKTCSSFAKIVQVLSVNLRMVFSCYKKQRILVHYNKGYKAARRYSGDLKLLPSLSPNGFRQTSFETALLSLY